MVDYSQFDPTPPYNPGDPGTLGKVPPVPVEKDPTPKQIVEDRMRLAKEQDKIGEEEIARLQQGQEQYMKLAAQRTPVPRDPNLQNIPQTPKGLDYSDPIKAFQNPAVLLATLGSLFSRAPLTAAMNAGGAAMEAYHKGEAEVFQQKRDDWKHEMDRAIAQNNIELEKYNAAWKKSAASTADKNAQLMAIAMGMKNDVLVAAIKSAQPERVDKILDSYQKSLEKLQEIKQRTQLVDDANIEANAQLIAEYKRAPPTGWAMNRPYGQAVMAKVREINPDYDEKIWQAEVTGAKVAGGAEPRADAAALTQLTKQNAAIEAFSNNTMRNGEYLVQLAEKVDSTGVPVIERWIRAGRQAVLGDTDVTNFNAQLFIWGTDVAKILTSPNLTGVLTDSARHEVQSFIPSGATFGQIKSLNDLIRRDFGFRRDANNDEIAKIRGRLRGGYGVNAQTPASATDSEDPWTQLVPGVEIREIKK